MASNSHTNSLRSLNGETGMKDLETFRTIKAKCRCGSIVNPSGWQYHCKSLKHQTWVKSTNLHPEDEAFEQFMTQTNDIENLYMKKKPVTTRDKRFTDSNSSEGIDDLCEESVGKIFICRWKRQELKQKIVKALRVNKQHVKSFCVGISFSDMPFRCHGIIKTRNEMSVDEFRQKCSNWELPKSCKVRISKSPKEEIKDITRMDLRASIYGFSYSFTTIDFRAYQYAKNHSSVMRKKKFYSRVKTYLKSSAFKQKSQEKTSGVLEVTSNPLTLPVHPKREQSTQTQPDDKLWDFIISQETTDEKLRLVRKIFDSIDY